MSWFCLLTVGITLGVLQLQVRDEHVDQLDTMDNALRDSMSLEKITRATNKMFGLTANHPKGNGEQFCEFMNVSHPGATLMNATRASGLRQDLVVERLVLCTLTVHATENI